MKNKLIEFENDIESEFIQGKIKAPIHLSRGNEEQVIEIFNNINNNDWVFSSHRNHLHALLKGIPREELKQMILDGKSMHIMSNKYKFFSTSIVGGHLPIAVGVALGIKRQGLNEKVFCFLGDMASMSGVFFESLNYATAWDLPITFIIEDNNQSTNTPTSECFNGWKTNWGNLRYNEMLPLNIDYYSYKMLCPHINSDTWVEFK